jgi:hypothetical protein
MTRKLVYLIATAGAVGLAACKESTSPSLFNDATVTNDVAASAGDAIAVNIETMTGSEGFAALPAPPAFDVMTPPVTVRTKTCYDGSGTVVAGCAPLSSVRKIWTHATMDGSRSGSNSVTGGATSTFTGAVHRVSDDTLTRVFNTATPPVETSRVHSGLGTAHDTTSFTNGTVVRTHDETAVDSTVGVTFNLPRASNPYPVAGHITRVYTVNVTFHNGTTTSSKQVVKKITVTFSAAGGSTATLTIDNKTCTLNLAPPHAVTGCQ